MKEKSDSPFKVLLVITFVMFILSTLFLTSRIKSEQFPGEGHKDPPGNPESPKVKISIDTVKEVMSGLYPQYRKLGIPMMTITVENPFSKAVSIYLESEIVGITHKTRSIEMVNPDNTTKIEQYPPLIGNLKINTNQLTSLNYTIKVDGKVVAEQSAPVKFVARDVLFWGYIDDGDNFVDTSAFIAAWVTPNHPDLRGLLKNASRYHPNRSLYGYQLKSNDPAELRDYARIQVKSIYKALKNDYDINYVNTPVSFTPKNIVAQRINLPSETLSRGIANCIDSTVLFASALEAIGFKPYILILPGHSLLGWAIDKDSAKLDFIDVTYVSEIGFEEAVNVAYDLIKREDIDFKDGSSKTHSLISIHKAREKPGIEPLE
jgi:hypothetical protein